MILITIDIRNSRSFYFNIELVLSLPYYNKAPDGKMKFLLYTKKVPNYNSSTHFCQNKP